MKTIISTFVLVLFFAYQAAAQSLSTGSFSGVSYTKIPAGYKIPLQEQHQDKKIYSPNRLYFIVYEFGNFRLVKNESIKKTLWQTNTSFNGASNLYLEMQTDSNLVMYHRRGTSSVVAWSSNTHGNPGAFLALQNDGNLVIYNSANNRALWASGTNGR